MEWDEVEIGMTVRCTKDRSRIGSGTITELNTDEEQFDMKQDGTGANVSNCNPEDFKPV